jgi:tetratricopeptide (TPR) repeat protein
MSRGFGVALVVILALLAVGGAAGFWIMRMDRDPPLAKSATTATGQTTETTTATTPSTPPRKNLAVGETVYLTVREPGNVPSQVAPLALRELVRQAFLLAARDELGLSTRDVMLREDLPQKPLEESPRLELSCLPSGPPQRTIIDYALSLDGPDEPNIWSTTITVDIDDPKSITTIAENAEALSRGELKEALTRAGGKGSVPAARASSSIPDATSDLLWTWNEISVLGGLRRVHSEIREKGESPQLLGALAVGYANLGSLTEYYYSAACKVYQSRALLYAERLLRKTNESSWARWHRGYVRTLFGLHNLGAEDILAAKQKHGDSPPELPLPFWTDVLDAFSQGQLSRMLKIAKTPPQHRLALYLNCEATGFSELSDLRIEAQQSFLKECADCPRGYDSLASCGAIGPAQEGANLGLVVTGALLRKRLSDVPGLPEATKRRIENAQSPADGNAEIEFRKVLIADLKQNGTPDHDRSEPSLSAVAHTIDEMNFAQLMRKVEVDRNSLGIPIDDTIAVLGPLVADHPYARYLDAFAQNRGRVESAAATLANKLATYELTTKEIPLLQWMFSVTQQPKHGSWWRFAGGHADMVFSDQMRLVQAGLFGKANSKVNAVYMPRLWTTSNKLPLTVAMQISRAWDSAKPLADKYEHDYADDPLVLDALAARYFELQRYDDAERTAKRYAEIHPSYPSYRVLARIYKTKKDHDHWRQTLEKAIKLPPYGLEQASVQDEIAHDLLAHKAWKEAAVYGDAAAKSYSGWSMLTAARCHEMLGDWDKAEQLVKTISVRYDTRMFAWMCWCHRTGHGDIHSADEFVRGRIATWGSNPFPNQIRDVGFYELILGDRPKALAQFQRVHQAVHDFYSGFHAALVADALGKTADRDALLHEIVDMPVNKALQETGIESFRQLAAQFLHILPPDKAKTLNLSEVDKILAGSTYQGSVLPYLVGAFLKNRGDLENAKKYLIRCAHADDWDGIEHTLACQLLREMKVEIPPAEAAPDKSDGKKASVEPRPRRS